MTIKFVSVERVRFDEDRLKEARFWASKSIAERVIAGWQLADEDLLPGKSHEPKTGAAITVRRIPRSKG